MEIFKTNIIAAVIVFGALAVFESCRAILIYRSYFGKSQARCALYVFWALLTYSFLGAVTGILGGILFYLFQIIFRANLSATVLFVNSIGIYVTYVCYVMFSKRYYELVPTIGSLAKISLSNLAILSVSLLVGGSLLMIMFIFSSSAIGDRIVSVLLNEKFILAIGIINIISLILLTLFDVPKIPAESDRKVSVLKATASGRSDPNILLITIDALRADKIGCYGNTDAVTPGIDSLAKEGVVFEKHFCDFPLTGVSLPTLFTGRYCRSHGTKHGTKLDDSNVTLAEVLTGHGYATAGFSDSLMIGTKFGTDKGFDYFYEGTILDFLTFANMWREFERGYLRRASRTVRAVMKWIKTHKDESIFLWIHLSYPHAPYDPPGWLKRKMGHKKKGTFLPSLKNIMKVQKGTKVLSQRDIKYVEWLYECLVAESDIEIRRIINAMRDADIYDETLLFVTADHGETLYRDDCQYRHGDSPYDEVLRIPLIVRTPEKQAAGKRIGDLTASIDLMPTVLDFAGVDDRPNLHGQSLRGMIEGDGRSEREVVFSETKKLKVVRDRQYKLVYDGLGGFRLYDLLSDPLETKNVAHENQQEVERLKQKLFAWLEIRPDEQAALKDYDNETLHRLKALGYV